MVSASTRQEIDRLIQLAKQEIDRLSKPNSLFSSEGDDLIEKVISAFSNSNIRTIGTGEISIEIDYEKCNYDKVWGGLKGYITNSKLNDEPVMQNYKNLWFIENFACPKMTYV